MSKIPQENGENKITVYFITLYGTGQDNME
jgi:hypothetical protein